MKSHYWSSSKFADWLRGTPKPESATTEVWNAWEKTAKAKKFRYWLVEEGFDYLQDFICWPIKRYHIVRCYINNRWVVKSHALTSNLKRGEWHEYDTRILHSLFEELVNYVEIASAWMQVVFSEEDRKKYHTPWYRTYLRLGLWRCPEAGIAQLEWAATLKWDDKNDLHFGEFTLQALAAQETLALYHWWKVERPKRRDPSEASGLDDFHKKRRDAAKPSDDIWAELSMKNKEQDELLLKLLNICQKLEQEQDDEDTAMLIRLIRIRRSLWT